MLATLATFTALAFAQQTDTQIAVRQGIRLEVNNYGGGIVVKAWNQNAVRVHAEHSSRDYVDVNLEPSVLSVKAASRRGPPGVVDYTINVPAWMALNLAGMSTDIEVDGTQGTVTAETVNGEIKCRGGAGYISLKSVEGAVALQDAKGRVEINTVNEGITLTGVSGDITAETVSGDIELEGIESSNVDVNTVSGSVLYEGSIRDAGHYRFSTHNGDVTLAIPEKANATVSVATFNGDFDSSFPVSVTGTTKHRFGFTIGTGSARLELETFNGDIKLRRPGKLHVKDHDNDEENH
jgi:DUF4097 and DUF4098 domain-containing protein YvlB